MKLILTRGIPGSGKTYWSNKWKEEDPEHREVIHVDELKHSYQGKFTNEIKKQILEELLNKNVDIVVDDLHLYDTTKTFYLEVLTNYPNYELEIKDFSDVSLEQCLENNKQKENPGPEFAIRDMYNRYHTTLNENHIS